MPDRISREPLTLDKLGLFSDFDCGDEPWARQVSDWITGRSAECAAYDLKHRRCKAFLYRNYSEEIIGFGSLGTTKGEWPERGSPRVKVAIIPWVGLHSRYHGKPSGPDEVRYIDQILGDLAYEARISTKLSLLVLYVDPRNVRAIQVYQRNGFLPSKAPLAPGEMLPMTLNISSLHV